MMCFFLKIQGSRIKISGNNKIYTLLSRKDFDAVAKFCNGASIHLSLLPIRISFLIPVDEMIA